MMCGNPLSLNTPAYYGIRNSFLKWSSPSTLLSLPSCTTRGRLVRAQSWTLNDLKEVEGSTSLVLYHNNVGWHQTSGTIKADFDVITRDSEHTIFVDPSIRRSATAADTHPRCRRSPDVAIISSVLLSALLSESDTYDVARWSDYRPIEYQSVFGIASLQTSELDSDENLKGVSVVQNVSLWEQLEIRSTSGGAHWNMRVLRDFCVLSRRILPELFILSMKTIRLFERKINFVLIVYA